jgi:hypothetical protein
VSSRNFFGELKRRNVYKVAVAYAVVAWLVIQATSIVLPAFEARAHAAFEAARAQQEKIVQAQPDYRPALCVLAMIDAALGHKELALEEGRRAIARMPLEKDVANGSRIIQYFAITAAWAGDKELALQQLETGLRTPVASTALSYGALKLLPFWDPLRGDPRFEKIVQSLAPKEASK